MDVCNPVAGVAAHAQGGLFDCGNMVMGVAVEIQRVTFDTGMTMAIAGVTRQNLGGMGPVGWIFQGWRSGVAMGTVVAVDDKRQVGRMADRDATRFVEDNVVVPSRDVDRRGLFVFVAREAVYRSLVSIADHHLHRNSRDGRVGVTGGVMAGSTDVKVGIQDVWPVQYRVAVRARLEINLPQVARRVELYRMIDSAPG